MVERRSTPRQQAEQTEPEAGDAPDVANPCSHAWDIDRPNQQVSHGRCMKCGAEKDFLNYGEELRLPFGRRRRS